MSFLLHHAQRRIQPSSKFILEDQQIIACGVIALFSICNLFGIKGIARVQNVLTGLKVLLLLIFVVSAILLGRGDWHNFSRTATRWTATPLWQQFPVSLFWIYVAYSGWNAATYVAEEIEAPKRTLPRALALGTGVVAVLYVSLNITCGKKAARNSTPEERSARAKKDSIAAAKKRTEKRLAMQRQGKPAKKRTKRK